LGSIPWSFVVSFKDSIHLFERESREHKWGVGREGQRKREKRLLTE